MTTRLSLFGDEPEVVEGPERTTVVRSHTRRIGKSTYPHSTVYKNGVAEARRDDGIKKVSVPNADWIQRVIAFIRIMPTGWDGTGETIKLAYYALNPDDKPTSHNAWGAVIRQARRHGLLEKTDRHTTGNTPESHARSLPIYCRP